MKYHIITFGCQANISDSEKISDFLNKNNQKTSNINEADLIIVNMCSVRQSAVDRVLGLNPKLKKLLLNHSNLITILTGCILEKDKTKFNKYFDYILDIKKLNEWPKTLSLKPNKSITLSKSLTANIHIITGCNNFCSYCVVPYTRGREKSKPTKDIILEIKKHLKNGAKEIWLLGQNVNSYKSKIQMPNDKSNPKFKIQKEIKFAELLKIINDIPGEFWVRFTSSHPKDFSNELITAMKKYDKITKYLNLPVQSGDNQILKKMNRHYTNKDYQKIIRNIRKEIPEITLSTDVIVGFPGETKKQFENTAQLFRDIKYDMAYINKYSPRFGTVAQKLKDNISLKEKKEREKILTKILEQTALKNNKKYISKTLLVLFDKQKIKKTFTSQLNQKASQTSNKLYLIGKTKSYRTIKIEVPKKQASKLIGKFIKVKIIDALPWGLKGILETKIPK
ncbi:MAG: MiaB/RimO family radical SAM methylthiotransferase [Candidatus Nealsonbacteria bacterium]